MPGLIQGIGSMLQYRQRQQEEAEQKQVDARKAELEFRMKLAEKTGDWPSFNKWVGGAYPGMGLEVTQTQIGGVKKKILETDVASGDVTEKEITEGGVPVSRETKARFDLADMMVQEGTMTPEQGLELKTKIKQTTLAEKRSLLEGVQKLKEDDPMRIATEKLVGAWVDKKKAPAVQEVGVKGKPGWKQKIQWIREKKAWVKLKDPYQPKEKGAGKAGAIGAYTISQRLDDLRATYKMKLQGLDREFGYEVQGQFFIKSDSMEVYKAARERVMREYFEDERLVRAGKTPKYLEEPTEKLVPSPPIEEPEPKSEKGKISILDKIWDYIPGQRKLERVK